MASLQNALLFLLPFTMDIIVGLLLFVGRHSLASQGYSETTVGTILLFYGAGYILFSLLMRKIIRPAHARLQIIASILLIAFSSVFLANISSLRLTQIAFFIFSFAATLYFNALQSFMLKISNQVLKPLSTLACQYTLSWSLGFALGPLLSSQLKNYCTWSQTYYLSTALSLFLLILMLFLKPSHKPEPFRGPSQISSIKKGYPKPAWVGILLAWTGWTIVSTYWPVQAAQQGFSSSVKGAVEFTFAISQAIFAMVLIFFPNRYQKSWWILLFGLTGVTGIFIFGAAKTTILFLLGASLYGAFTASIFTNLVYQAMAEPDYSVRRVAINEVCVGIGFTLGPILGAFLHRPNTSFAQPYYSLGIILAAGIIALTWYSRNQIKKTALS